MVTCRKIEPELQRVVNFRIGDGASEKHPLIFDKKTLLSLISGPAIFTDGQKIHLPLQFGLAPHDSDNEMMLASAVRHESDHIKEFIKLHQQLDSSQEYDSKRINRFLEDFFLQDQFKENPTLAHEIFNVVEDNRIDHRARRELPGLRKFSEEKEKPIYLARRPSPKYLMKKGKELNAFREFFLQKTLLDKTIDEPPSKYKNLLEECVAIARDAEKKDIHTSLDSTAKIYQKFKENFDIKQPIPRLPSYAGRGHDKLSPGIPRSYRGQVKPREGREDQGEPTPQGKKKTTGQPRGSSQEKSPKTKPQSDKEEDSSNVEKDKEHPQELKAKEKATKGKDEITKDVKKGREKREKKTEEKKHEEKKEKDLRKDQWKYLQSGGPFVRIVPRPSPGVILRRPKGSPNDIENAHKTIEEYNGEIRAIESYFRRLEERYKGKKRAKQGEEINIGEYVQAELEYEATGVRPNKKMFRKRARIKKKAAWAVLADISSSTGFGFGYKIIDYIKSALLIQGEALNYSGYPFGIFAFHSGGRLLKEMINYKDTVYIVKDFKENYSEDSRGRIMSLYPYGGTLMVNAIEYIAENLKEVEGRPKGFSIITDGEPDTPEAVRDLLSKLPENEILPFLFVIGQEHEKCAKSLIDDYVIIKRDRIGELPNEVLRIFTTYGIIK
jgi:nitric oxide reductase activation protein